MCAEYSNKSIACDASSLISLADTCFLPALAELKAAQGAEFLITEGVKAECIDTPLRTRSHTLPAIRLQLALNDGVIRLVESGGVKKTAEDLIWTANNIFFAGGKPISIFHKGEAETIALAISLGLESVMIDERNARLIIEDPDMMGDRLEHELGISVRRNDKYIARLKSMTSRLKFFRSSELLAVAYERGYFKRFRGLEREAVEAGLYGLKFAGCSISFDEIGEITSSLR